MKSRHSELLHLAAFALTTSLASGASAQDAPPPNAAASSADEVAAPPDEAETQRARAEFLDGASLVKKEHWAEALAAFERSAKLRSHAVTTFNIGFCERSLGHYTRARRSFVDALAAHEASAAKGAGELSESLVQETRGYLAELDGLFVRAKVTLAPSDVKLAVDGRPLLVEATSPPVLVAGVRPPGDGERTPASTFTLVLNPGQHLFTLRRKGFADAVIQRSFGPAEAPDLDFALDRLPATLEITATEPGAVVSIDGLDVGVAPLKVSRPLGAYRVLVRKPDYDAYEAEVVLESGETTRMRASLNLEEAAFYERWWFWAGTAVAVGGAVAVTYFATRPDPERPPVNGGGLGWAVEVP